MIEIDGSHLEGGGQIIRTCIGLSALTGKPCKITSIRANRPNPGLKTQHLKGIEAVKDLCNGKLTGASLGSREIEFHPGKITKEKLLVNIETAGSIGLVLQTLLTASLGITKPLEIEIRGGATHAKFAPPLLYTENVLLPILRRMGLQIEMKIKRHGFFPKGGGDVDVRIRPSKLKPLVLDSFGELKGIQILTMSSSDLRKARVSERAAGSASEAFRSVGKVMITGNAVYDDTACTGSGIMIRASTSSGCILGSDALGERGKPAEKVGEEAAKKLIETLGKRPTVDEYLSDQLLPFMALAPGRSVMIAPKLTGHAETNMWAIRKFLDVEFQATKDNGNTRITCG